MAAREEVFQLSLRVLLVDDLIFDIRAIETRDKARRAGKPEPIDDLLSREVVGRSGERDARHVGKALGDDRQANVFWAKVVAPLRHAMRLVDRKQGDLRAAEHGNAGRRQEPPGSKLEEIKGAGEEPR